MSKQEFDKSQACIETTMLQSGIMLLAKKMLIY
jgi:hypothetical protein